MPQPLLRVCLGLHLPLNALPCVQQQALVLNLVDLDPVLNLIPVPLQLFYLLLQVLFTLSFLIRLFRLVHLGAAITMESSSSPRGEGQVRLFLFCEVDGKKDATLAG